MVWRYQQQKTNHEGLGFLCKESRYMTFFILMTNEDTVIFVIFISP